MPFLSPFSVLWLVLWAMVLFVVAPHLDPVCRSAARTVRVGSFALIADLAIALGIGMGRLELLYAYQQVVSGLFHALFWGSLAGAAWQIVKAAPAKQELR